LALKDLDLAWAKGRDPLALSNKVVVLKTMGRGLEAYELSKQVALIDPSAANYYNLALIHRDNKQFDACRQLTGIIFQNNPSNAPNYSLRGICGFEQQQYKIALADLLRSNAIAPEQAETYVYIGKSLMKLGKLDEGTNWILRGSSLYLRQSKIVEYEKALKAASERGCIGSQQ